METYERIEDRYYNGVRPIYADVRQNFFDPDSLDVCLTFCPVEGKEYAYARVPLFMSPNCEVTRFVDGVKQTHKATEADQREAILLLRALFPAWSRFCDSTSDTMACSDWFEQNAEEVKRCEMDIKVRHYTKKSGDEGCKAYVMDPRKSKVNKAKPEVVAKKSVLTRFAAALKKTASADAPTEEKEAAAKAEEKIPQNEEVDDLPF